MDFDRLVDEHEKPIFNLIYRLVGDMDEAADLTQETFVAAYKSFASFRGESSVYTWLYRIAVNRCKNKFKADDRRRGFEDLSLDAGHAGDDEPLGASLAISEGSPGVVLERKELRAKIERAISQLPPDYKVVVVLRDLQGLSYDEIAGAAELSVDVVRTRLARARAMLRQRLGPYLSE